MFAEPGVKAYAVGPATVGRDGISHGGSDRRRAFGDVIVGSATLGSDAGAGKDDLREPGCTSCHTIAEVRAASGGTVNPSLDSTHTGGPFPNSVLRAVPLRSPASPRTCAAP
jgi:hypothetical protein